MAFGDFLHKVASVIGLEAEKGRNDGYDDYDYDDYDGVDSKAYDSRNTGRYSSGSPGRPAAQTRASQPFGYGSDSASSYARKPSQSAYGSQQQARDPYDNIVQMPDRGQYASPAPASASSSHPQHGTVIVYISRKDDAENLINYVLKGQSVILSCERIDDATTQRVIDILSGAAYAVAGHVEKISKGNYLFAPSSVEIYSTDGNKPQQPYTFTNDGAGAKKTASAGASKYAGFGGTSAR
jgi:cell division inhibitor SepF